MRVLVAFMCLAIGTAAGVRIGVPDGKGYYCLLLQADISGAIKYQNKQGEQVSANFALGSNDTMLAGAQSKCADMQNALAFDVPSPFAKNESEADITWTVFMMFNKTGNGTSDRYSLVNYSLDVKFTPEQNSTVPSFVYAKPADAKPEWSAAVHSAAGSAPNGFSCSKNVLQLANDSSMIFENLKIIAFGHLDKQEFPASQEFELCELDVRTSDLIPIVVGACLAGLVIVVLIAYLIGRARAKRQGYASV